MSKSVLTEAFVNPSQLFILTSILVDIDECQANSHDCDLSATCTNTDGSFTCVCHAGYNGDGKTCTSKLLVFL